MAGLETFYDIATRRFDDQTAQIDALDAKAATVMGAAGTLLPIFGVLFGVFTKHPSLGAIVAFCIAFAVYLVMIYATFLGSRVGRWDHRPDLHLLEEYAKTKSEDVVRLWVAQECARAVRDNAPKITTKASNVAAAWLGLIVVGLLLVVSALFQLFS